MYEKVTDERRNYIGKTKRKLHNSCETTNPKSS